MKKWNEFDVNKAINLHNEGKTFKEIGFELIRTEKAIKEKLKHYGLKQNKENCYVEICCENCGKIFSSRIAENRKCCSHSCAATINNKKYPKRTKEQFIDENGKIIDKKYCKYCGKFLCDVRNTYCNNTCKSNHIKKSIFNQIENNTISGSTSNKSRRCKKYLIEKHGEKCMKCDWNEINPTSNKIPIEIEHIDGNSDNCELNNMILLCPNCHSLTPTFRALNKGNGRHNRMERYKNGKSYCSIYWFRSLNCRKYPRTEKGCLTKDSCSYTFK